MAEREQFSSRWGLILAALGMAIGTGNIWRFPREAASQGGGAFLIAWVVALFCWSIPLIMVEFAMGKSTRRGTIGAFTKFLGPRHAWMGAFVGFCTIAILFYYTVVTGWCLKYFTASIATPDQLMNATLPITEELAAAGIVTDQEAAEGVLKGAKAYWYGFNNASWGVFFSGQRSLQPILFHALAMLLGAAIVGAGVVKGIQRANRIFIPALFILLIAAAIRACTLDGAVNGIEYLFHVDTKDLGSHNTWLRAFSQSAWSTGAGWGLILTYAVYTRKREDVALNSFVTALGNNSASLIAALAIIPVVFALQPDQAETTMREAPQGLAFITLPQLFLGGNMPGGRIFLPIFFLALSVAALSSLISLVELGVRNLMDMGLTRRKAITIIGTVAFLFGIPSACALTFFTNQDWVWGVGLLISGAFVAYAAIRHGIDRFRREQLNVEGTDIQVGRWFNVIVPFLIPAEFVGMLAWWFFLIWPETGTFGERLWEWLNPIKVGNAGTCLVQWAIVLIIFIALSRLLARLSLRGEVEA